MKKGTLLHLNLALFHDMEEVDVDDLDAVLLVLILVDPQVQCVCLVEADDLEVVPLILGLAFPQYHPPPCCYKVQFLHQGSCC